MSGLELLKSDLEIIALQQALDARLAVEVQEQQARDANIFAMNEANRFRRLDAAAAISEVGLADALLTDINRQQFDAMASHHMEVTQEQVRHAS